MARQPPKQMPQHCFGDALTVKATCHLDEDDAPKRRLTRLNNEKPGNAMPQDGDDGETVCPPKRFPQPGGARRNRCYLVNERVLRQTMLIVFGAHPRNDLNIFPLATPEDGFGRELWFRQTVEMAGSEPHIKDFDIAPPIGLESLGADRVVNRQSYAKRKIGHRTQSSFVGSRGRLKPGGSTAHVIHKHLYRTEVQYDPRGI